MLRVLFLIFILYLVYKFVFDFIIPVSKATATVKSKMREMQQDEAPQQRPNNPGNNAKPSTKNTDAEYIDFEEVK